MPPIIPKIPMINGETETILASLKPSKRTKMPTQIRVIIYVWLINIVIS